MEANKKKLCKIPLYFEPLPKKLPLPPLTDLQAISVLLSLPALALLTLPPPPPILPRQSRLLLRCRLSTLSDLQHHSEKILSV